MSIFTRRPIDLARRAAAVAAEAGWAIERWGDGGGAAEPGADESFPQTVSMVVVGEGLRGPALATLSLRGEDDASREEGFSGVVSEHVPRKLSPPALRATRTRRGHAVVLRLVEQPAGGTLEDLLGRRARLAVGEAVTVLAAVARALADLHASGRAGALLTPRHIGFRDDGCPVLTGGSRLRPLDHVAAQADVRGYAALVATVCATVGGATGAALLAAATAVGHRRWEDVIQAVLRTADPIAVACQHDAEAIVTQTEIAPAVVEEAVPGSGTAGTAHVQSERSWDLEATVRRGVVRAAAASPELEAPVRRGVAHADMASPRGGRRERESPRGLEATAHREVVGAVVSASNDGWDGERRAAVPEVISRRPMGDDRFVQPGIAPPPAARPRASARPAKVGGRDPAGGDRVLRAMERLLDGAADRPVARAMGVVRAWAVARPLVVAVALVPVVGVLLVLLLFPPAEGAGEAVGKSSSALLRESGTGPNSSCDG